MSSNLETVIGMVLGGAAVWYMWNKLDDWVDEPAAPRSNRKFTEEDLKIYDGGEHRMCYVAIGDEVFDVTKDKEAFKKYGGGKMETPANFEAFKEKYHRVGSLIVQRPFTKAELSAYDGRNGRPVYVCAKGVVYEVDPDFYGPEGPYGIMAGKDATRALALVSLDPADIENSNIDDLSWTDKQTLDEWVMKFEMKYHRVGWLVDGNGSSPTAAAPKADGPTFLKKDRQKVVLAEKRNLSHDTRLFRFKLPSPDMRFGLPIGKHVKFFCPNPKPKVEGEWNGRPDPEAGKAEVERKYTPASLDEELLGHFDMVIKVYTPNDRFCDGGKMSQYMDTLEVGDEFDVCGPFGLIEYKGKGVFNIRKKDKTFTNIGMMAGGTGITPMLQLIKAILRDPQDETKISLIFANQTEEDILVRDMLEELANAHPDRFRLHYTLDRPPAGWKYSTGFINEEMIKKHMPPPSDETVIFMCGPPPMIKFACKANLDKLGYNKAAQVEF